MEINHWKSVDINIESDLNKRKRGSEMRLLLMLCGAEVGEIN
jgi:hypothetical protein